MRERYKNALMWGLYAALVLLVLVCVMTYVQFGVSKNKVHYQ